MFPAHLDETTVALFVEHRLADGEIEAVERHIDGCAACRALIAGVARGTDVAPVAPDPAAPEVGTRVGRYVVVGTLGKGAMGVVYAAFDPDLDRKVAVKVLRGGAAASEDVRARLVREAQALAKVSHPAVIAVHDVGTHDGQTFIAMELVDAGTLRTWLGDAPRTPRDIVAVMAEVGRGLAAAHATGLIHRDVKPDNILVGADRRARIGDFGLAVAVAAARRSSDPVIDAASRSVLGDALTVTGATVGTPAYMAPEQIEGRAVTAASDQFSFCVTLYEALYGVRPYPGATLSAIAEAMRSGVIAEAPPARRAAVPGAVDRAVRRGLAIDPAQRFPDLTALVAALAPAVPARRSPVLLGAAGAIAIAATAVIASQGGASAPTCSGFGAQLRGVWDDARHAALAAALTAGDKPFARAASDETARIFDRYAGTWIAARTDACKATRVAGDQSERVLDLRMRCLDRRRDELGGLVTALTTGGAEVAARSVDAAAALVPVDGCADVTALEAQPAPPADPLRRDEIARLTAALVSARSEAAVGHFRDSAATAAGVVTDARTAQLRDLEAEGLLIHGQVTYKLGDAAAADVLLRDAAWAAEASRRDDVAARARINHVATGVGIAAFADAHDRVRAAAAAIERAGAPASLRQELATQEGVLAAAEGHYDEAQDHFAVALTLAIQVNGGDHVAVARALNNLGNAQYSRGHYAEARATHERALAIRRGKLGDDHPDVGTARINLAHDLSLEGHDEDALVEYREGLRILEATTAPDNPRIASTLSDIGLELQDLGRLDESLAAHQRAVEILDARDPGPEAGFAHENLAGVLLAMERPADALVENQRALEIRTSVLGPDHPDVAQTLSNMARAQIALGKYREALAGLDRAMVIKTASLGADHVRLAPTLIAIGQIHLEQHHPRLAVEPLERARKLLAAGGAPLDLATCQVQLARALHGTGQHARAQELAAAAAKAFAGAGKTAEADEARALLR